MPIYEYRCTKCRKRFSYEQSISEHGKAPRLPEMQVAGGGADVLDVLRQDRSQKLTARGPSACGVRAAARNLPFVVPDPRNRGEARSHGRANDQLGLQVLSRRKTFRVISRPRRRAA